MDSVSTALGLEGKFRIYVGQQYADVTIAKTDTLRDINQKIGKLKDQSGQALAAEAMILDNRLVIKSRNSGSHFLRINKITDDTSSIRTAGNAEYTRSVTANFCV